MLFYDLIILILNVLLGIIVFCGAIFLGGFLCPVEYHVFNRKKAYAKLFKFRSWQSKAWAKLAFVECSKLS